MTEDEWLGETNPAKLLRHLTHEVTGASMGASGPVEIETSRRDPLLSDRKMRLYGCACVRQVWDWLEDPRSRKAVEAAEAWADIADRTGPTDDRRVIFMRRMVRLGSEATEAIKLAESKHENVTFPKLAAYTAFVDASRPARVAVIARDINDPEAACDILRDITGNPWQRDWRVLPPVTTDLRNLALAAYKRRLPGGELDPTSLAVLADCAQDVGCDDEVLLRALRGENVCAACCGTGVIDRVPQSRLKCEACNLTGWVRARVPRYRGFWPVDLFLGRN